jgi:hypothetical protein
MILFWLVQIFICGELTEHWSTQHLYRRFISYSPVLVGSSFVRETQVHGLPLTFFG